MVARRDAAIASRCAEASSSVAVEDGAECVYGVKVFTYLGRPLEKSDDNWQAVFRNIRKEQKS